ncbi:hypothetical protein [Sphaerisporangium sp. TRM90804]|uniref:hypothetical protein n=1 Tax=Sphaerisporangium sp. TRM90804 TaxID=3031113 RepID=UPI002449582F|nr:hypothetical protein [Sphaerisporangium sp. TRM90804]MDH2428997.1 hypothetical protein [Sphaerisporangium sp. TRM90804]
MYRKLRSAVAALPLSLLLVLTGGVASNAQAAGSPVLRNWDCDPGGSLIWCAITVEGGVTPYTYQWYKDGDLKTQFTGHVLRIGCIPGNSVRIDVVVTDATGQQVSAWAVCTCLRDWQ